MYFFFSEKGKIGEIYLDFLYLYYCAAIHVRWWQCELGSIGIGVRLWDGIIWEFRGVHCGGK